jgi:hypothetical protein
MASEYEGGCLCGAVRYRADAAPVNQRVCHCRLCQKAIGAAFNARLLFRVEDVTFDGLVETVHSSPPASSADFARAVERPCSPGVMLPAS